MEKGGNIVSIHLRKVKSFCIGEELIPYASPFLGDLSHLIDLVGGHDLKVITMICACKRCMHENLESLQTLKSRSPPQAKGQQGPLMMRTVWPLLSFTWLGHAILWAHRLRAASKVPQTLIESTATPSLRVPLHHAPLQLGYSPVAQYR